MIFSYRTRQFLKRAAVVLLYIALVGVALAFCLLLWLRRFIVYTPEGAHLDFSVSQELSAGIPPEKPSHTQVSIEYVGDASPEDPQPGEETPEAPPQEETRRLKGYYIEPAALQEDIALVRQQLEALPAGTPVLLDVKSIWGNFYYSSAYGKTSSSYDIAQMDELIAYLAESQLYVIARLPALRDYNYALANTENGLPHTKGYLWVDSKNIYWLDPRKDGTLTFLVQVIKELRALGFDEVVLQDFYVPESENINFSDDRQQVINDAAQALVTACATDAFTVSFVAQSTAMQLPEGRSRLYLMDIAAPDVADVLAQMTVPNPETDVVILAPTNDTRYDVCGTLRPLSLAH